MVKMWRYYLPNEGWAEIMLCSTGMFAAVSDYGDYVHAWRSHGEKDFRIFVADLAKDPDYFMRKVGHGLREYDGAETLRSVKREILSRRRSQCLSAGQAREEWALLREYDDLGSPDAFSRWCENTRLEDAWEHYSKRFPSSLVTFGECVLPRLRAAILAEMAAERQVA
jgi:hypothetical protein